VNTYLSFLLEVLSKADSHGMSVISEKLLNRISELEDPLNYAGTGNGAHNLYYVFLEDFPFLNFSLHSPSNGVQAFSGKDSEDALGIVRWVRLNIEGCTNSKVSSADLTAILFPMMVLAKRDRCFWREFPVRINISKPFFKAIGSLFDKLSISPKSSYSGEEKSVEIFTKADTAGDFVTLDSLSLHLRGFSYYNDVLRSIVKLLAYHDFDRLLCICSAVKSAMVAKEILEALPSRFRFHIAYKCSSLWIKFTCMSLAQQDRRQKRFSKQTHRFAVGLIKQLLENPNSRDQFFKIYCTYPSRTPVLLEALGEALAAMPKSILAQYVTSIKVDWNDCGRDEVAKCLRSFKNRATLKKQKFLFQVCYEKWLLLIDQKTEGRHHFDPFKSELDYGVITYISGFMSNEDIKFEVNRVGEDIRNIMNEWHDSSTGPITRFHKLLSKGQPYCHVINLRKKGGGKLLTQLNWFYDFCDILSNPYLRIKYHCDWVKTFSKESNK